MAKLSIAKRPVVAVGAAAVAILAATGISAQARETATTPTNTTPGRHGVGSGVGGRERGDGGAALAKALGVTTAKLQAALDAIDSPDDRDGQQTDEVKALAGALGTDAATITTVLDAQRPAKGDRPGDPAGTTPAGTTPGTAGNYPSDDGATTPTGTTPAHRWPGGGPGPRGRGPGDAGPGGPGGGPHRGPGGGPLSADNAALVAALAKATGKDEATVKAALTKLADDRKASHDAEEAAFAKKLAAQLGLDATKVADALKAARPTPPTPPAGTTPAPATP